MRKTLKRSLALVLVFALVFTTSGMSMSASEPVVEAYAFAAGITPASALPQNRVTGVVQSGQTIMFRNVEAGQFMTALGEGGTHNVGMQNRTNATNQQWVAAFDAASSNFFIRPVAIPSQLLTANPGYSGSNVYTSDPVSFRPSRQTWHFLYQNNGTFRVQTGMSANNSVLGLNNAATRTELRSSGNALGVWEIIRPTRVSFNVARNHGDPPAPSHRDLFEGTTITRTNMPTATKTNADFLGWHTDPNATTPLQSFRVGSENVTLYAIFHDRHPVTYNIQRNGGATTNAPIGSPPLVLAGDPVNLNFTATRDNARFLGWNTNPDATAGLTSPHPMPNYPLTLFAIFLDSQQVTFDANGGDSVSQASTMVFPGDLVNLSPTATIEYGRFLGWHTDPNATEPLPSFTMPSTPITLFAIFEMQQTVTFESVDGTSVTRNTYRYFAGDAVDLSRTATREHARFLGWNTTPNARPPLTTFMMPSGNTTLYAIFDDALFLTFDYLANGGNGVSRAIGRYFEGDTVSLAPTATREHARFLGWSDQPTGAPLLTSFTMPSGNTTLFAIFEDSIVLTYNYTYNEGTGVSTTYARFFAGEPVDLTPTATKPGWAFVGWNTDPNATTALTSFDMPNQATTLYAIFRLTSVVHFIDYNDAGRQTRTVTIITYNRDVPQTVTPLVQHHRTGWVMLGWTAQTTANAHTNPLPAGELSLADPNALPAGDVPFATHFFYGLYESPVVVSFDAQGAQAPLPQPIQRMSLINSFDSNAPLNPTFPVATAPQRTGYFLVEWRAGDNSFAPGSIAVFGEDTELTAVWTPGVAPVRVPVTGISLSAVPAALNAGDTLQLLATVLPANATERGVLWGSSDPAIATVDHLGNVTVHSIGSAVITATTVEGGFTATAMITVAPVEVGAIALSHSNATITIDEFLQLQAIFMPGNASDRRVAWASNNPTVATVDSTGRVRGLAIGDAIITATAANGMTASMNVTVAPIRVESAVLSLPSTVLHVGDVRQIAVAIIPINATNQSITWSSSSDAVSVDAEGRLRANRLGVATITATIDGQRFSISVDVRPIVVTNITLLPNEDEIVLGNTRRIHASITPHHAENATLTWSTSDSSIATVDAYGLVMTHALGTAIVTARTLDGSVAATATITVLPIPVERVAVNINAVTVGQGQTQRITAFVSPANATDQRVIWSSSNTAVATVDQDGLVTTRSAGRATITVTARDGSNASASTTVTVPPRLVQSIQPSHWPFVSVTLGDQFPLTVGVLPFDACDPAYRVTVSNSRIVRYANGVVTALAQGIAYVIFTALDGSGVTARTRVIVHQPVLVEQIRLPIDAVTLDVGDSTTLPTARIVPTYATNGELATVVSDPEILSYANGTLTRLDEGEAFVVFVAIDGGGAFAVVQVMETPPSGLQAIWNTVVNVVVSVVVTVVAGAVQWVVETIVDPVRERLAGRRSDTTGVAWPFHNTGTAGRVDPVEDIWITGFGWVPSPWGVNTYLYAINVRTAPAHAPDDGLMIQRYTSLAAVRDAVVADMQRRDRSIRIINGPTAPIHPSTEYRFALRVGHNPLFHEGIVLGNVWDYRFMVQTDTGAWAYKQGWYREAVLLGDIDPAAENWSLEIVYEFDGRSHVAAFENFFNSNTIFFAATRNDNY